MLAADAVNGQPVVRGSEEAFSRAISRGVMSDDPEAENYAGLYMYMYSLNAEDFFKHGVTRRYLSVPDKA